jgi:16S rRNA (guanine527-N7)-methyltransferase
MFGIEIISKYFSLDSDQYRKFQMLGEIYKDWNQKVNLISRKDIDQIYLRHVLHSLALVKIVKFSDGFHVVDIGSGGGFPGIPLAIMYPNVTFDLVDSKQKKMFAVKDIVYKLSLNNVTCYVGRMEEVQDRKYNAGVCRAVAPLSKLISWTKNVWTLDKAGNSLYCLKGGDLNEEMANIPGRKCIVDNISDYFEEDFFITKKIVTVRIN